MICITVVAASQAKALDIIKKSANRADVLELRMDLLNGGNVGELINAVRSASPSLKVMVTNRPVDHCRSSDEKKRIDVLLEAVSLGVDFVDVELTTKSAFREKIITRISRHRNRTALIVSHHDFRKTPSRKTLNGYFHECMKAGARIVKIVTMARSPRDNLSVLGLIPYARRQGGEIIAFCMGEHGIISRVMAPLLGSLIAFASLERGAESASGQLTVGEMRQIFRILEGKGHLKG